MTKVFIHQKTSNNRYNSIKNCNRKMYVLFYKSLLSIKLMNCFTNSWTNILP